MADGAAGLAEAAGHQTETQCQHEGRCQHEDEGSAVAERELQEFANARLAAFKVPRRILVLEEIPKGATGKLQRIGLAQKLGLV